MKTDALERGYEIIRPQSVSLPNIPSEELGDIMKFIPVEKDTDDDDDDEY